MAVSRSQGVTHDVLRHLPGVDETKYRQILDTVHAFERSAPDYQGLTLDKIERAERSLAAQAKQAEATGAPWVPLPIDALHALLEPVAGDVLESKLTEPFPSPAVSAQAAVRHEGGLDAKVPAGTLSEAADRQLARLAPEVHARAATGDATVEQIAAALGSDEARKALGGKALSEAMTTLAKVGVPEHVSRDLDVNLDSHFTQLDGSPAPGEIGLYQKRGLEHLFVRQNAERGITVHGFEVDSLVVTVPKGARVVLLDKDGDQRGGGWRGSPTQIGDQSHQAVEISRSVVQPSSERMYQSAPSFGLRVVGADGNVLYEKQLRFDAKEARTSKRIFSAELEARRAPSPELAELYDHAGGDARGKITPFGERPRLTMGGEEGDRIQIRRDGQTFSISSMSQLLGAHGFKDKAFKISQGRLIASTKSSNDAELDRASYVPTANVKLRTSSGRGVTFDSKLSQTLQAHMGCRGLRVYDGGRSNLIGEVDPFAPEEKKS